MQKLNIDRVQTIIGEINAGMAKLEKIKKISKDKFLASPEKIDSAKYNLIVVIEGAIDICNHVAVKVGGRAPKSYSDCFTILKELDLFSPEFTGKLQRMAKFRNLLVHLYWQVDDDRVFDIIKKDISIVTKYLETIKSYILKDTEKE
jgi:uncharacterized protein YutE (UPF0331/DUF86 family)